MLVQHVSCMTRKVNVTGFVVKVKTGLERNNGRLLIEPHFQQFSGDSPGKLQHVVFFISKFAKTQHAFSTMNHGPQDWYNKKHVLSWAPSSPDSPLPIH